MTWNRAAVSIALLLAGTASGCVRAIPEEVVGVPPEIAGRPAPSVETTGATPSRPDPPRPPPYEGLGAWVDIFDRPLWRNPERTVEALARRDVSTLFLQTTSYRYPGPIRYPSATARFLEAAHARGINVVGWYVPDFAGMRRDLAWSVAAARFRTAAGHRFDSIALDIEVTGVADPVLRSERVVTLSRRLRAAVGADYPLGAITPSPLRGPNYWPILPVAQMAQIYDVVLPMAYWNGHARGAAGARDYIARSIRLLRAEAGGDVAVHVIGGVADEITRDEVAGFARAVREEGPAGASVYDVGTMRPGHWAEVRGLAPDRGGR